MSMLSEVTHLQDVVANLCTLSQDPSCLPDSAEEAISDALHDVVQPPATLEQKVGTVTVSHYITLRVDNLTSKFRHQLHMSGVTFLLTVNLLRLSICELEVCMGETDDGSQFLMPPQILP